MALGFGRKKNAPEASASDAPVTPVGGVTPTPLPAENAAEEKSAGAEKFDLDSFAAELESGHGLVHEPSLDSALRTPPPSPNYSNPEQETPESFGGESTVESVSEPELLDLNKMFEVESREAIASGKIPAPAPYVPASMAHAGEGEPETPFYEPQVPVESAKKKLPLVPIVGLVAILALGGAAALLMGKGAPVEDVPPAPVAPPTRPLADKPPAPETSLIQSGETITVPLTPALRVQLKTLWNKGAAAKRAKDYAGARTAWSAMLKLRPGHPGIDEAIAKLPVR